MNLSIKMKREEGGLKPLSPLQETLYKDFVKAMPMGQIIEVVLTPVTSEGTRLQLSKLHAMIREISSFTGQDFEDVKLYVKKKAGFMEISSEGESIKSFADMNKDELSSCIQATIDLGSTLGLAL